MRKSEVWVSAVLYMSLGIILVTLILAAGLPLANKMRDRNTVVQTKALMYDIDQNIREVINEAPGSRRYISPVIIDSGKLVIDADANQVKWSMLTGNKMMEPDIVFKEGVLNIKLSETSVIDEYIMELWLDYSSLADLTVVSEVGSELEGRFSLGAEHTSDYTDNLPVIQIQVK